jgi:hypothetical protein
MTTEAQLKEWQKFYRQSVQALPVAIGFIVVVCGVLWGLSFWFRIPTWLTWIVVGASVFPVLMDAINILYLRGKFRAAARSDE